MKYKNLRFNCNILKRVEQVDHNVVLVFDKLNWKRHITALTNKLVKYASSFELMSRLVAHHIMQFMDTHLQYNTMQYNEHCV